LEDNKINYLYITSQYWNTFIYPRTYHNLTFENKNWCIRYTQYAYTTCDEFFLNMIFKIIYNTTFFSVGDFYVLLPKHIANKCGNFGYIEKHGSDSGCTNEGFERDSVIKNI